MIAFHSTWTRPFSARNPERAFAVEPFELFTTALSALLWRKENGRIFMLCDAVAAAYYESIGLSFLWDGGVHPILDAIPADVNPGAFWAAGKLYALSAMKAPCVMLDTDFIVWKPLASLLDGCKAATIHSEDISPKIYPNQEAFRQAAAFDFSGLDWQVRPLNTALAYFGDDAFRKQYLEDALGFIRACPAADDPLIYMVFAEQRMLAMSAAKAGVSVRTLSDLPDLFQSGQQYFTHTWGFKQQMRDSPALLDAFCRRCAKRLQVTFADDANKLRQIPVLSSYFENAVD